MAPRKEGKTWTHKADDAALASLRKEHEKPGRIEMADIRDPNMVDIDIRPTDIELHRSVLMGRIRTCILEAAYNSEPGRLAGAMSDLRALAFIHPTRADPDFEERQRIAAMNAPPRTKAEDLTIIANATKAADKALADAEREGGKQ